MQGRWTLTGGEVLDVVTQGPSLKFDEDVPVVPCDDAAIERAAQAAVEFDEDGPSVPNMDWYRDMARAMFHAAGETP